MAVDDQARVAQRRVCEKLHQASLPLSFGLFYLRAVRIFGVPGSCRDHDGYGPAISRNRLRHG
jgi:hypothetical protein